MNKNDEMTKNKEPVILQRRKCMIQRSGSLPVGCDPLGSHSRHVDFCLPPKSHDTLLSRANVPIYFLEGMLQFGGKCPTISG